MSAEKSNEENIAYMERVKKKEKSLFIEKRIKWKHKHRL